MSVRISTSRLAHVLSTPPGTLSGPTALLTFTLSRVFLTSAVETDSGWSSGDRVDLAADSLLRRSKQHFNCFFLIDDAFNQQGVSWQEKQGNMV